jgi:uncharacterized protein with HEPN domain
MPRDARAYLSDIIGSCDAIEAAVECLELEGYVKNRLVRSSVEREFIIIGEAIVVLSRTSPDTYEAITKARRIIDFRNRLAHEYSMVDDEFVFAIANHDVSVLRDECRALLGQGDPPTGAD